MNDIRFCKDCLHFIDQKPPRCGRSKPRGQYMVSGIGEQHFACETERIYDCGIESKFFEPRLGEVTITGREYESVSQRPGH